MKRMRILIGLITAVLIMVFSSVVGCCDAVDDFCNEYEYDYRWTVEVELDETYNDTWLGAMADNNKVRISYIHIDDKSENQYEIGGYKQREFCIIEGKTTRRFSVDYSGSVSDDYIRKEEPKEYNMYIKHYNLYENEPKRFVVIEDFKKNCTTILVEPDTFTPIQDTSLDFSHFNSDPKVKNTFTDCIIAKGIMREDMKKPEIPHEEKWAERNDVNVPDMHYDADVMLDSEESDAVKAVPHGDVVQRIFRTDGTYSLSVREGRVSRNYFTSRDIDTFDFSVEVPLELADKEITSDGKMDITVEMFNHHAFGLETVELYGTEIGLGWKRPKAIVTFKGDMGKKYGFMEIVSPSSSSFKVRNHFAGKGEPQNIQEFEDLYFNVPEADKYDAFAPIYEMFDYDGNVLHVKLDDRNGAEPLPMLFLAYYTESGALSDIGLIYEKSEDKIFSVPISKVALNEEAEILLTMGNFKSSKYLARPVVQEARALRGEVDNEEEEPVEPIEPEKEPEDEPVEPTEPEEEPKEEEEEPADKGGIRIIIDGTEVEFDVEPIVENERVLVPLRAIFEKLGDEVVWDPETGKITITGGEVFIEFTLDKAEVTVNDEVKVLDAPARVVEERTLVPLRFLSEELGNTVVWNETENTVTIDR